MCNIRLDDSQVGITIARGNINNPKYTDDTILMAESEETESPIVIQSPTNRKKN